MTRTAPVLATTLIALAVGNAHAAEGMWTPDNLPRMQLQEKYGFAPDQAWIDHAQRASVRITGSA